VLLHSQKCSDKLRNDSTFVGCKAAVETITSIRNSVQCHSSSGELTKYDYYNEIDKLRIAVVDGLGYDAEDFKQAIEDSNLCNDSKFYQVQSQMFTSKLSTIEQLLKDIKDPVVPQEEIYERAKSQIAEWDEWIKDSRLLRNFDSKKNQYMLVVDRFDEMDQGLAMILEGVPWKLVIDLDPDSDNTGILHALTLNRHKVD